MKNKNSVSKYFTQKELSVFEILLLIFSLISAVVAIFVTGGGPIGIPLFFVCITGFAILRSQKIKDDEIDQAIKSIVDGNNIELTENTLSAYDLRNTKAKKKKSGKIISSKYCITNIVTAPGKDTVLNIHLIDLIAQSVEKVSYNIKHGEAVSIAEETIDTNLGSKKVSFLTVEGLDQRIPVEADDYRASQLLEELCGKK